MKRAEITVRLTVQKQANTDTVRDGPKSSLPMATSEREDYAIKIRSFRYRFKTLPHIQKQRNLVESVLFFNVKIILKEF